MRMRFFFILPDEYARVSCPLSSFTRKRASGSSSCTVPSNSIRSSLAKQISSVKGRGRQSAPALHSAFSSGRAQIYRGDPAALTLFELIAELLALAEIIHSRALDGGDVDEDISAGCFRLDKPVTLLRIKPFDRTGRH